MRFAFSDEQEQLRLAVRRFLADQSPTTEVRRLMATDTGYDPAVWGRLCNDLGVLGVHVPETYGGQGFTFQELAIIVEEMGRALFCAPYFSSTALAATAILNAGSEADRAELLPPVASGERLAAFAFTEPNGRWDANGIEATAHQGRLSGTKSFVVDGHIADALIVVARRPGSRDNDGLSFYAVDRAATGLSHRLLTSVDATRKLARLDFDQVEGRLIGEEGMAGPALARTLTLAAVALANEMVGGAAALLESAVAYAGTRVQFGRVGLQAELGVLVTAGHDVHAAVLRRRVIQSKPARYDSRVS